MAVAYRFQKSGDFVIQDYNRAKPWSSFFPGIAGLYGIPLWAFYVNRGQCVASVGIRTKDEALMEFLPANKAYQLTPTQGFRTFIKIGSRKPVFWEPFSSFANPSSVVSEMIVRPYELEIVETNKALGLEVRVVYFCLTHEPYPALVRQVTLTNRSSRTLDLTVCDGLSVIVPYGVNNWFLKEMGRTIEAWMTVENMEHGIPLYKLSTDPRDTAQVSFVRGAHFYMGFLDGKSCASNKVIADPQVVFGSQTDLIRPRAFEESSRFSVPSRQAATNKMPCAFSLFGIKLAKQQSRNHFSLIGHVFDTADVKRHDFAEMDAAFIAQKRQKNRELIEGITDRIFTASGLPVFERYAAQTYLDNVLRGGLPCSFSFEGKTMMVYVYSRKHGDLERDYNRFMVTSTYFSGGEGNYRDVNQNRRNDGFFNPDTQDQNLRDFMNCIQLDGYNPLVFKGRKYVIHPDDFVAAGLAEFFAEKDARKLGHILSKPFGIGEVLHYLRENKVSLSCALDELVHRLLSVAKAGEEAAFGEGYWSDHWTYNSDLLESFYALYPERMKEILFDDMTFTYFDSPACVRPRSERYCIQHGEVRQYHAVSIDEEKNAAIQKRHDNKNRVCTRQGAGEIYKTTLIDKFVCLIVNKIASLDPYATGVEMEADKPNWYDALNGLPGLLGSSLSETFELKRLILLLKNLFEELRLDPASRIPLTAEIHDFLWLLKGILESTLSDYEYWDQSQAAKEAYRARIKRGVGDEGTRLISLTDLKGFFDLALRKLNAAIAKGHDKATGSFATYFSYAVSKYETHTDSSGHHHVTAREFRQKRLPLFLEGFVHALRTEHAHAPEIYRVVKKGPLWDKKLKMYKVNASLEDESYEIGRARAFGRGWLENESIWLHMEYKYLLELLKNGLIDEFYDDFFKVLIPFQKPGVYGRSILENSSFIASSAHADPSLHGRGFVARLSGSTAELIHMWLLMSAGPRPFRLDADGQLCLQFQPALPGSFFTAKPRHDRLTDIDSAPRDVVTPGSAYSFLFLGRVVVTYLNPQKKNTYGSGGVSVKRMRLYGQNGLKHEVEGGLVRSPVARQVRQGDIQRIEIELS